MAKEEAKPIEQDDGLEELEAFKKRWEEFEPPQVVTSDHLVNQPVNGELAPEQVDAIATGVRPQVG